MFASCLLLAIVGHSQPVSSQSDESAAPWVDTITPQQVYFVSPGGGGDGSTPDTPITLEEALHRPNPGDAYYLLAGRYQGVFETNGGGSADAPVLLRAWRDQRATIEGALIINDPHIWVWGLEITDPDDIAGNNPGLSIYRKTRAGDINTDGVHVINNYIHDVYNNHGLTSWNRGSGHVIYGNIIVDGERDTSTDRRPHSIYAQNDVAEHGVKYFVNNILFGIRDACRACFNFHGFARGGHVSGMHLERNAFIDGSVEVGTSSRHPATHNVLRDNLFYDAFTRLGYNRVFQAEISGNVFWRSLLDVRRWWGDGYSTDVEPPAPTVVTGNTFAHEPDAPVRFATTDDQQVQGQLPIRSSDVFDHNRYYLYARPLGSFFWANGGRQQKVNGLQEWQSISAEAGNAFDLNAQTGPLPDMIDIVAHPNAYDPQRLHLFVINWPDRNSAEVALPDLLSPWGAYTVLPARDPYGTALATIRGATTFRVPLEPGINAFLVTRTGMMHPHAQSGATPQPLLAGIVK